MGTNWENVQPIFDSIENLLHWLYQMGFKPEAIEEELQKRFHKVKKCKRWFDK